MPIENGQRVPELGPGRRAAYRPDHKSFGEFILSEHMRGVVVEVCKDIADLARQHTPYDEKSPGPHMADQYEVVREAGVMKVDRALRVQVNVVNSDPKSAAYEFGNSVVRRRRMLGRAGAAHGDFKHGKGEGPARQDGTF